MKRLNRTLASFALVLGFAVPALVPIAASAQDVNQNLCNGANFTFDATDQTCNEETSTAGAQVDTIVTTIINVISLVVGVVSVIMIIVGGLRYITSNGDSGNVTNAKNTILYAIIGLVIVALAQLIVQFVIERVAPAP
jgi:cytochrome bd-type quinol oxidase subunit 2